ncbi:MAG: BA14K family protein [Rhizobiaceae bacterium]|nr:BA14K family protein [Rhizobiaceae bacterium]
MRKLLLSLCAAAFTVGTAVSTAGPVAAAPIIPLVKATPGGDVIQIQDRRRQYDLWRAQPVRPPQPRRGYYQYRGNPYYNGHRGYSYYRPGYRRYNDFWFPAGAFVAGALLGGALAAPAPVYREPPRGMYSDAHVRWCYNRYRSYRAYDNTFQPYNGPRQQCYSPYS